MSGEAGDAAAAEAPETPYRDEDEAILAAIAVRARSDAGYPDAEAVEAMEHTVDRLAGAAVLLEDLMILSSKPWFREEELHLLGLVFLTGAMSREATRLYQLYFGNPPAFG